MNKTAWICCTIIFLWFWLGVTLMMGVDRWIAGWETVLDNRRIEIKQEHPEMQNDGSGWHSIGESKVTIIFEIQ